METVITAKLSLNVNAEELKLLEAVSCAYRDACNHVSSLAFHEREYNAVNLQKMSYAVLRDRFALKAQMAISVTRTVAARYTKEIREKLEKPVSFSLPQCDQVRGRDWAIDIEKGIVSLNTLKKRIKVSFSSKGFEKYINKDALFGGAKLVLKNGKAYLHVSVRVQSPDFIPDESRIVGVDRGIINTAVRSSRQCDSLCRKETHHHPEEGSRRSEEERTATSAMSTISWQRHSSPRMKGERPSFWKTSLV